MSTFRRLGALGLLFTVCFLVGAAFAVLHPIGSYWLGAGALAAIALGTLVDAVRGRRGALEPSETTP